MTNGFFKGPRDFDPAVLKAELSKMLTPRDRTRLLLRHTLIDQQLDAIKAVIRNHEVEREKADYQLEVLDTDPRWQGDYDGGLDVRRDEHFWHMTFQASAHSMSAVGMLAPFIESLFVAIFDGLKTRVELPADHPRCKLGHAMCWKPQFYLEGGRRKKGFAKGALQLAEAIGLLSQLPADLPPTLSALSAYRNAMFHNGFEWPDCPHNPPCEDDCSRSELQKFGRRIHVEGWPEGWFEIAERNGKPWLYYMSPDFCDHCVKLIDDIIEGVGRYLRERDG